MSQTVKKGIWETGWENGVAAGEVKGKAGSIIHILTRRFRTVSKPVKEKVGSITDIDRLDKLTDQALDCQSLAEFSKSLQSQQQ